MRQVEITLKIDKRILRKLIIAMFIFVISKCFGYLYNAGGEVPFSADVGGVVATSQGRRKV